MVHIDSFRGRAALTIAQGCAVIEIGALPLWMGSLIGHYGFDPQEAGSMVSLYMAGAVLSGFVVAPLFGRLSSGRAIVTIGLAFAAVVFFTLAGSSSYTEMALLHLVGGLSIGPALAVSVGTVGRSSNPHQLFAITAVASSLTAAIFLGIMPRLVDAHGGQLVFQAIAAIFAFGSAIALLSFPQAPLLQSEKLSTEPDQRQNKIPRKVWFGFTGVFCLSVIFSMTMSFVERVGMDRGYGLVAVSLVLTIMAIAKMFPAAIAGLLQKRLTVRTALFASPVVQALASGSIFAVPVFAVYAIAAPIFIMPMLFAQVFAFGLISKLEPSGRASALIPSISMLGAVVGPTLGGTIVIAAGYSGLATVSFILAAFALFFFARLTSGGREATSI
ncbi:MAG: MFS transporter [Sphingorhabdus sp.]